MTSIHDMIDEINNCGIKDIFFDHLEGWSCVGDIRSNSWKYPLQYTAYSTKRPGDDEPFEGTGWTPVEAIRNLLKQIKEFQTTDPNNLEEDSL